MSIVKCLYGAGDEQIDVTTIVVDSINTKGYILVSNANFGDPCYGMVKELIVTTYNGDTIIVKENKNFRYNNNKTLTRSVNVSTLPLLPTSLSTPSLSSKAVIPITSLLSSLSLSSPSLSISPPLISPPSISPPSLPLPSILSLPDNFIYKVYYHIYASAGKNILEIFEDQISTIMSCPLYDKIQSVNCCLTGNDMTNYTKLTNRIQELKLQSGGKIRIRKLEFNDKTYEKFTYYTMRDDILSHTDKPTGDKSTNDNINNNNVVIGNDNNTFIFYLHSKGVVKNTKQIRDWRKCMEYFLLTRMDHTMMRVHNDNADSAGCFYRDRSYVPAHYSGNFWVARKSFLRLLFSKHGMGNDGTGRACVYRREILTSDYYAGEFYLFKQPHRKVNLFGGPPGYDAYNHMLPLSTYAFD